MEDRSEYPSDKRKYPIINFESPKSKIEPLGVEKIRHLRSILNEISEENIRLNLELLTSFVTRHSKSKFINNVAEWIQIQLKSYGYSNIQFHEYEVDDYHLRNVICTKKGKHEHLIMICAHYDCIMENVDDNTARAPGANDNASGVSALLEISRIFQKLDVESTVQFVYHSGKRITLKNSKNLSPNCLT